MEGGIRAVQNEILYMERIVLIDAYSQIFRCYYAMKSPMSNSRGEPTGALFGIARLLLLLNSSQPSEFGAVCFDKGHCKRRCELLPDYKAQRAPMPDELRSQVGRIREWMTAFGWNLLEQEGVEADDLIAAVTGVREDREVRIVTHDKDIAQLITDESVSLILSAAGGVWEETRRPEVEAKFGVPPELLGDYLALVGDAVDNIRGVEGVGPKTAAKLLLEHGSLEGLLGAVDTLKKGRVRDNLAASAELLRRNRQLVALDMALPEGWNGLEGIRRRTPDWQKLLVMAEEQGFRSLQKPLEKAAKEAEAAKPAVAAAEPPKPEPPKPAPAAEPPKPEPPAEGKTGPVQLTLF